jgi:hypothetical protein
MSLSPSALAWKMLSTGRGDGVSPVRGDREREERGVRKKGRGGLQRGRERG